MWLTLKKKQTNFYHYTCDTVITSTKLSSVQTKLVNGVDRSNRPHWIHFNDSHSLISKFTYIHCSKFQHSFIFDTAAQCHRLDAKYKRLQASIINVSSSVEAQHKCVSRSTECSEKYEIKHRRNHNNFVTINTFYEYTFTNAWPTVSKNSQSRLNVICNANPCSSHKSNTFCKLVADAEFSIKSSAYANHPRYDPYRSFSVKAVVAYRDDR